GNVYTQQYTLISTGGAPPVTSCTGTTFKNGVGLRSANLSSNSTQATGVTISQNTTIGTTNDDVSKEGSTSFTLADTSAHTVSSYRPPFNQKMTAMFSYTVNTAATPITAILNYTDPNGNNHNYAFVPSATNQAVGRYQDSFPFEQGSNSAATIV